MATAPRRGRLSPAASPSGEVSYEAPPNESGTAPGSAPAGFEPGAFEAPPEPGNPAVSSEEGLASGTALGIDPDLLQMKQDLEQRIFGGPPAQAAMEGLPTGDGMADIVGVGIGPAHHDFDSVGAGGPGAPVLNVYVSEPMDMDQVKGMLVDSFGVRALSSDRTPVNVIRTGPIDAYAHRHRERPAPCGISVAHRQVTAGTQGALARGRSGPRANRLLLLSNDHALANSNAAAVNDPILQAGPFAGGGDFTFANKIQHDLDALDIALVT